MFNCSGLHANNLGTRVPTDKDESGVLRHFSGVPLCLASEAAACGIAHQPQKFTNNYPRHKSYLGENKTHQ